MLPRRDSEFLDMEFLSFEKPKSNTGSVGSGWRYSLSDAAPLLPVFCPLCYYCYPDVKRALCKRERCNSINDRQHYAIFTIYTLSSSIYMYASMRFYEYVRVFWIIYLRKFVGVYHFVKTAGERRRVVEELDHKEEKDLDVSVYDLGGCFLS